MRKKLWIALIAVIALSVAAGAQIVSGLKAQDPPKKEETKKDDWLETLKKALESKKDGSIPPPSNVKPEPTVPPPPLPAVKDDKPVIPPPTSLEPLAPLTPPDAKKSLLPDITPVQAPAKSNDPVKAEKKDQDLLKELQNFSGPGSLNSIDAPKAADKKDTPIVPPPAVKPDSIEYVPPPAVKPEVDKKDTLVVPPPAAKQDIPPIAPIVKDPPKPEVPLNVKPPSPMDVPQLTKPVAPPPTVQIAPNAPISEQVAKMKDCAWSLHVEIVDGKTIMTCTVHKKHEFKIVCQSVDLQTGKHILKATGQVQITGDMLTGSCENLSIPLMEDRLVMEGSASVNIQKTPTTVSNEPVASFLLKGTSLDLRISEIVPATPIQQASWQPSGNRVDAIPVSKNPPANIDGKKWTGYGRLMPAKIQLENEMAWGLVGQDGKVIAYVVARDGGTLNQYEGRTISVLGTNEQISGRTFLRVTHIAVP